MATIKTITQRLFGRTVIDSLDLNQNGWYIDEEQVTATAYQLNNAITSTSGTLGMIRLAVTSSLDAAELTVLGSALGVAGTIVAILFHMVEVVDGAVPTTIDLLKNGSTPIISTYSIPYTTTYPNLSGSISAPVLLSDFSLTATDYINISVGAAASRTTGQFKITIFYQRS